MSPRKQYAFRPTITELERREVPSVSAITASAGILTVKVNNATSSVLVSQTPTTIQIKDSTTNHVWSYNPKSYSEIVVVAGSGADTFTAKATNPATAKLVEFIGGKGADNFVGQSGTVSMQAGSGNDTLVAQSGNDTLIGGSGTDSLKGGSGDCLIEAGSGNDYLNGGTGTSTLVGGIGNDTIVAMNGLASDTVQVGLGFAVIWEDSINGLTDTIIGNTTGDVVQEVSGFANSGATNVLNGGTFKEPALLTNNSYETFSGRPLFASGGPTVQDVNQLITNPFFGPSTTLLTDSWLLSALGAIAQQDPQAIENNVVDFGDGTYGVDLNGNYFRVDSELPVNISGEAFSGYASAGQDNSMWVPIVEKAFAYYASPPTAPTYRNLQQAQGGTAPVVYQAFGATDFGSVPLGGPGSFASAQALGSTIVSLYDSGYSLSVDLTGLLTSGTNYNNGQLVLLSGPREYTVIGIQTDVYGNLTDVILRDPSGNIPQGVDVTLTNLYTIVGAAFSNGYLDYGND
jgi:hypothetical protein